MILEGIITTVNDDGGVNISPMGPLVDEAISRFTLRPYQTSRTYANLKRTQQAVFHVTDDAEMLARAAVGDIQPQPPLLPAESVEGFILSSACRWYALQVNSIDDRQPRTEVVCEVVQQGRLRDFFGWNRAKHAVVEAAILATRIEFLPAETIHSEFEKLRLLVDKTGGPAEHAAFDFLTRYVEGEISPKTKWTAAE